MPREYQIPTVVHKACTPSVVRDPRAVGMEVEIEGQSFLSILGALEDLRGAPLRDATKAAARGDDFVGTGIGALEVCGGKDVQSRCVQGGDDGDPWMVVEATYR